MQTEVLDEFLIADGMTKWGLKQKRKCKKVFIKYLIHMTAMISQSAKQTEVVYEPAPGNEVK